MPQTAIFSKLRREMPGLLFTLGLVLATTAVIFAIIISVGLTRGSVLYIVPVMIAAIRWGLVPALFAAGLGVIASAYFFFPPLYSFTIRDPQEVINLLLYIFTAIVVSQLATRLKRQLELSRRREIEMRNLYAFSRRLAAAFASSDIHAAIEDHLATVMQHKVVVFPARDTMSGRPRRVAVPDAVRALVDTLLRGNPEPAADATVHDEAGHVWLVRAISPKSTEFGIIAVDMGRQTQAGLDQQRAHIAQVLDDANATLERLDIARAINEARMRARADQFIEALLGSVSHELRTPLASILGAATVLGAAPALARDRKLSALVNDVRNEAERLNDDIQNLLDATRISSNGIEPRNEWTDPADIINSAIERCRRRLKDHRLSLDVPPDLPLIHVDSVLVQQALVQMFDNAAKYSAPQSRISVRARVQDGQMVISVADQGLGLTAEEKARIWDRFFRGARHTGAAGGSGLGLWVAHAFIAANGGTIEAASDGAGRGATFSIRLPILAAALAELEGDADE